MKNKKLLALVFCLALVLGLSAPAAAAWPRQFKDSTSWPGWAIQVAQTNLGPTIVGGDLTEAVWFELMVGDPPADGDPVSLRTFRPYDTITRAEYAAIMCRAMGLDAEQGQDVWYRPYVDELAQKGILEPATDFGQPIKRREMGRWIGKALAWYGLDLSGKQEASFGDLDAVSGKDDILLAAKAGVIKGYPDGTFGPDKTATRAEAAAMAVRLAKLLRKHPAKADDLLAVWKASDVVYSAATKAVAEANAKKDWTQPGQYSAQLDLGPLVKYKSAMMVFGPDGARDSMQAWYDLRPQTTGWWVYDSYTLEPVFLCDALALTRVSQTQHYFDAHGKPGKDAYLDGYLMFARRGGRWIMTDYEDPDTARFAEVGSGGR